MSDFYSLLKQSIIDRGISDPDARDTVYDQARRAVIRRLRAYRPAFGADEIDARLDAFDTAVKHIERDLVTAFAAFDQDTVDAVDGGEPAFADGSATEASGSDWEGQGEPDEAAADDDRGYAPLDDGARYAKRPYHPQPPRDGRDPLDDGGTEEVVRRGLPDRWRPDPGEERHASSGTRLPPAQRRLGWRLSERDKIGFLLGAIGGMAVILVGFGAYLALPTGDEGASLPVGVRRQVSDAATAARIPSEQLDVRRTFVVFHGRDPTVFLTTPDNPVRLGGDADGGFTRISSSTDASGIKAVIGPGLASQLAGQRIRVIITARSSAELGAVTMRFAYKSGLAISHWQTANLTADYADVGLVWRVPTMRTSSDGSDSLIIEPGIPGAGTGADIRSIRIDLLASSQS